MSDIAKIVWCYDASLLVWYPLLEAPLSYSKIYFTVKFSMIVSNEQLKSYTERVLSALLFTKIKYSSCELTKL